MSSPSSVSLTSAQAAERLGVSIQTVQKWVDAGALLAWRTVGGHRRVDAASVDRMLSERRTSMSKPAAGPVVSVGKVMLVEDDADAATILKAQVRQLLPHAHIRVIADGFTALIEAGREPPDLLITDINLPGMDGIAMVRRLREHRATQGVRVVMVTHHNPDELRQFGAVPQNLPVLRKPLRLDDLRQALDLPGSD